MPWSPVKLFFLAFMWMLPFGTYHPPNLFSKLSSLMAPALPDANNLPNRTMCLTTLPELLRNGSTTMAKKPKAVSRPPNCPDLNPHSHSMARNKPDAWNPHPTSCTILCKCFLCFGWSIYTAKFPLFTKLIVVCQINCIFL